MPPYPNLCAPSYVTPSPWAGNAETINLYPEHLEVPGTTQWTLNPTPGCTTVAESIEAPNRGMFAHETQAFTVQGQTLYEIDASFTLTSRGTLAQDANPAQMVTNGDGGGELLTSSGGNAYLLDLQSLAFSTVLTGKATQIDMLDGYFLALDTTSSTLYLSDLLDGTTWDPTQFAQRSTAQDPWKAMRVVGTRIWLMGSRTSEPWYDAGNFPFPFAPYPGALIPQGIAAPFSLADIDGALLWLAQNDSGARTVQMTTGISPTKVSTHAIDAALASYNRVEDAEGVTFQMNGHNFYALTFPAANKTWVYDLTESAASGIPCWHRWETWNAMKGDYDAKRVRFHCYQFNRHLVGDRASGIIATMSPMDGTEIGGGPIRWLRRPPVVQNDQHLLAAPEIQLLLRPGTGTTSGQGFNPTVLMRTSQDAGQTWSHYRARTSGKTGEYTTRVRWLRNGRGRNRQDEWVGTDPIPAQIVGGLITVTPEAP